MPAVPCMCTACQAYNTKASLTCVLGRPGIGYSDDKLLQWRLMSYDDTQRYRIGPNFGLLPVNRPRCPVFSNRQVRRQLGAPDVDSHEEQVCKTLGNCSTANL